jgi:peptidoglycan hydrolase-like protein with peptidoglycan-binding domain
MARVRTAAATGAVLAVVAGASGWAVTNGRAAAGPPPVTSVATGTAEVVRTDVAERHQVAGTLSHTGDYDVVAAAPGTLTRLPAVGAVIERGDAAYEVDGSPVVLLYGARPAWRPFAVGMTDGADVRQLETGLAGLGHGSGLTVDRHFSAATARAVRRWQRAMHLPVTGTVPLGQVVFAPGAVRIAGHDVDVAEQVQPGAPVEHGTGVGRAVTMAVAPRDLPTVQVGQRVVVTLPDGTTQPGRIATVGAVAEAAPTTEGGNGNGGNGGPDDTGPTVPVTVAVTGTIRGFIDQAEVQVAVADRTRAGVLAVPITALRAVPGGTYEVVVTSGGTTRHVPVETGLFDETTGMAEVEGPGLAEGQKVEVPRDGA